MKLLQKKLKNCPNKKHLMLKQKIWMKALVQMEIKKKQNLMKEEEENYYLKRKIYKTIKISCQFIKINNLWYVKFQIK